MLTNKNIVVGVTGGIAAYKACTLVSRLTQSGANVKVIMTKNATKLIAPLTFQALSRNEVFTDTFIENDPEKIAHIHLADWADLFIIAPATANIIAKMAHGIADDMLSTTILATTANVYVAPAMNVDMYKHPAVIQNMQQLTEWDYHFIEPGDGYLACGYVGIGRLEEPEQMIQVIENHQAKKSLLQGKKVLVSAGPTRESLDPVRFFSNHSSGKMGFALAEAAAQLGAEVTLVTGPVHLEAKHPNIERINIVSAQNMYDVMHEHFPNQDIVIKAAAVADYRPKQTYDEKMKKQPGDMQIEFARTKDILQSLGERKTHQFLVGFAAETSDHLRRGAEKLNRKNLDAIVINNIAQSGAGFAEDTNIVTYLNKHQEQTHLPLALKESIAKEVIELMIKDMKDE
ncbi:MAG TPA: bifunctional phosphopantothenoylcysteine decarboxylase/phosphopantothenate--cysteine ligase CoaBC [Bacillota bacterium]|nr:bifunctional phosphopantothenoylcysteine decarboxylase/phosphopantothenate--cysteine ligase CoaBC [Bacillota bacterium]